MGHHGYRAYLALGVAGFALLSSPAAALPLDAAALTAPSLRSPSNYATPSARPSLMPESPYAARRAAETARRQSASPVMAGADMRLPPLPSFEPPVYEPSLAPLQMIPVNTEAQPGIQAVPLAELTPVQAPVPVQVAAPGTPPSMGQLRLPEAYSPPVAAAPVMPVQPPAVPVVAEIAPHPLSIEEEMVFVEQPPRPMPVVEAAVPVAPAGGIEVTFVTRDEQPIEVAMPEPVMPEPVVLAAVETAPENVPMLVMKGPSAIVDEQEAQPVHVLRMPEEAPIAAVRNAPSQTALVLESLPGNIQADDAQPEVKKFTLKRSNSAIDEDMQTDVRELTDIGISIRVARPGVDTQGELMRGYEALKAGFPEEALGSYGRVLQAEPGHEFAMLGQAISYQRMGELAQARDTYARILAKNPRHEAALTNMLALLSQEDPAEALAVMQKLEDRNPKLAAIPAQMASLLAQHGDYEGAARKFVQAMKLDRENLSYKYNLAVVLDRMNNKDTASRLYRSLLKAGDEGQQLPVAASDIQERLTILMSNKG